MAAQITVLCSGRETFPSYLLYKDIDKFHATESPSATNDLLSSREETL